MVGHKYEHGSAILLSLSSLLLGCLYDTSILVENLDEEITYSYILKHQED